MAETYRQPLRVTQIETGTIRGIRGNNPRFTIFKGVPYAAPPVGPLRWKRPQPAAAWEGVRDCVEFAPASCQCEKWHLNDAWTRDFCQYEPPRSEDCLYLNVWTPACSADEKLPVFVWIHGGAYANGNGAEIHIDGEGYCKRGVVFVSINYRLGALGYMAHPELSAEDPEGISGNYGLYDQIAALRWVQRNIHAFGGDPNCVTIGGQSAGAGACLALSVSPLTEGLFHRMIIQSGFICSGHSNCVPPSLKEVEEYGVQFAKEYNCSSLEELRQIPGDDFGTDEGMMVGRPFLPVNDGIVLKEAFIDTILRGEQRNVDIMMGNTQDEMGVSPQAMLLNDAAEMGRIQEMLGRKQAYLYCFTRKWPGPDNPGAIHGAEQWYEFETLYRGWRPFEGADYELSTKMSDYFANFIKTGDPNGGSLPQWTPYTHSDPKCMELGVHIGMIDPYPKSE